MPIQQIISLLMSSNDPAAKTLLNQLGIQFGIAEEDDEDEN